MAEKEKQLVEKDKEIKLKSLQVGSRISIFDQDDSKYHYATIGRIEHTSQHFSKSDLWFTVLYESDDEYERIKLSDREFKITH